MAIARRENSYREKALSNKHFSQILKIIVLHLKSIINKHFFDSDSFEEVVQSIEKLSTDNELASSMGEDARKYIIEHFSSSKVLTNFEKKVKEIINKENLK